MIVGQSDADTMLYAPAGWRWSLVVVADTKRALSGEMPPADRLRLLEGLDGMIGNGITKAAVACVEPSCAVAAEMACEAQHNLDVFGKLEAFQAFAQLNPSLLQALRLCGQGEVNDIAA